MELRPQTKYITRTGQEVFIDTVATGNPFTGEVPSHPALGYIGPMTAYWRLDGTIADEPSDFDIVSEFEDFISVTVWGHEDLDTGEQGVKTFFSHKEAFDACTPGLQVIEMLLVQKVA